MAQKIVTTEGTLVIPGAYSSYTVKADSSGLGTTGVLLLVGEADAGPDYTLEDDLQLNSFGPDEMADVVSKYISGPLVDAARAAATPANDPNITGAPSRLILVKTNVSAKATATLLKHDASVYGYLADKSYGKLGNLIYTSVESAQAEVAPTTGSFTWIPSVGSVAYAIRVDGAASVGGTLAANLTPTAAVAALTAHAGVLATGGVDRAAHPGTANLSLTASGAGVVTIASDVAWATTPTAGDTLVIPDSSVLQGSADANVGAYVITAATANLITATKLSDAGLTGAVAGTVSTPVNVGSTSGGTSADLKVYSPVVISSEVSNPTPGVGKTLEIAQLTTGGDLLERVCYKLGTITKVTATGGGEWISRASSAKVIVSAAEYKAQINISRQLDSSTQELVAGGEIALKIGYTGTSAAVVVSDTAMTITTLGGSGATQTLDLADFPTIGDLATFLNSKTGFTCSVGSGILAQLPATALDDVTTGAATEHGAQVCRLKVDGYKFFKKLAEEASLVQLQDADGDIVQAPKGLPAPMAIKYLEGGTKGGTTAAAVSAAIDALEKVKGNFLIPLFARDASEDVAAGLTDSSSTYTIDAIHAACRSHVLKMSTLKQRRNRQAILSTKATFEEAKAKASNIASNRAVMTFQDVKNLSSDGTIKQFQPWMGAVVAAGMQAAGFYKAIVGKVANISGALQAAGDFDSRGISDLEDALLAGLLPLKEADGGGYEWVSDQTTYGKDANFVYNSLQAVYCADVIAMSLAEQMERQFKGQSTADVSAAVILSALETALDGLRKLKLIAPSDDAPKGYKNVTVKISGPSASIGFEAKLAGALYFLPINFAISAVSQSA